jgi:hypothetical protein
MSSGVNYNVNAYLSTQGSFAKEMGHAARSADTFGKSFGKMSDRLVTAGDRVRGSFGAIATTLAGGAFTAGAGGLVAGISLAAAEGVKFNDTMEQGALGLATMYQTFGVAEGLERNVELAKAFQFELIAIADASPGTTDDMINAYTAVAPAISAVTDDLLRQRDVMGQLATMAWTTKGDYKQMGADFGRIIQGQAGGDVQMYQTLVGPISKAFEEVTGKAAKTLGEPFTQQFNEVAKGSGETALKIMEKVLSSVPPEFADAFGVSFGGVFASLQSKAVKLGGDFGKPLFDAMRTFMSEDLIGDGPFSEEAFGKLREIAFFSGDLLANAFKRGADLMVRGIDYVANNWLKIAESIRNAGVLAGKAIQTAIAVGATRHIVGTAMGAAGAAMGNGKALLEHAKPVSSWIAKQSKMTHAAMGRGMRGKGKGILGGIGEVIESATRGKRKQGVGPVSGLGKAALKITSLVTTVGSLAAVAGIAAFALGGVAVVLGGAVAYVASNWDRFAGQIVAGFESGTISIEPVITALYTFYARLELVGEALFGNVTATGVAGGGIDLLTGAINIAAGALGYIVKGVSIMVGAFGALKLGMLGVAKVILMVAELGGKLGAVDDSVITSMQIKYQKFSDGVDDTFRQADKLSDAADAIGKAQLSRLDSKAAKERAAELQKGLSDLLTGKDKEGKAGRAKKPGVKIGKVEVIIQTDDPDPDRLMAAFIPKLEAMSTNRVQPYDAEPMGS